MKQKKKTKNQKRKKSLLKYEIIISGIISIMIFILCILISASINWYKENIIDYSKISVTANCDVKLFNEQFSEKYKISGMMQVNKDNPNGIILMYDKEKCMLIHEECHLRQFQQNRLSDCNYKTFMFINEVECYTLQRYCELLNTYK